MDFRGLLSDGQGRKRRDAVVSMEGLREWSMDGVMSTDDGMDRGNYKVGSMDGR